MTVHLHRDNEGVTIGQHSHTRPADLGLDERTWSYSCHALCEERVLKDVEHSARHAGGVPQTVTEAAEAEQLNEAAKRDVSRLALALGQLADAQATITSKTHAA